MIRAFQPGDTVGNLGNAVNAADALAGAPDVLPRLRLFPLVASHVGAPGIGQSLVLGCDMVVAKGLVNHVVDDTELMNKTMELAEDMAGAPTFALGLAKKLFHMASGSSLEAFLEMESLVQPQLNQTLDHKEGVAACKEKRKPKFVGR